LLKFPLAARLDDSENTNFRAKKNLFFSSSRPSSGAGAAENGKDDIIRGE